MQQLLHYTHLLLNHPKRYIHTNDRLISVVIYYHYYSAQNIKLAFVFDINTQWLQFCFFCTKCLHNLYTQTQCYAVHSLNKFLVMILHNKYLQSVFSLAMI